MHICQYSYIYQFRKYFLLRVTTWTSSLYDSKSLLSNRMSLHHNSKSLLSNLISLLYTCCHIINSGLKIFHLLFKHFRCFLCLLGRCLTWVGRRDHWRIWFYIWYAKFIKAIDIFFQIYAIFSFLFPSMDFLLCTYTTFTICPILGKQINQLLIMVNWSSFPFFSIWVCL